MTNKDNIKLREDYKKETGLTVFDKDDIINSIISYINWLEKRLINEHKI